MDKNTVKTNNDTKLYDDAAERAVLGAVLHDFSFIPFVLEYINANDFFDARHKELFSAIVDFYLESGISVIDKTLFYNFLSKRNMQYPITDELLDALILEAITDEEILKYVLEIIKEYSRKRELLGLATKIQAAVNDKDSNSIMSLIQDTVSQIVSDNKDNKIQAVYDIALNVVNAIETFANKKELITGVSTGIADLDMQTTGFQPADLIVLAARPGMGKSALMLSMIHNMAVKNVPSVIFSLEMTKEQLIMRLLSSMTKIPMQNLRSGMITDDQIQALKDATEELKKLPIYVDDTPALSISELRIRARRIKMEKDIKIVAVDYLQLLRAREKNNRQEEVAEISRNLKALAKELNIPVLALAQLSRQIEQRGDKKPQLADLRESGQIEQDADIIMFLHRPAYYKKNPLPEEHNLAELIIAKQRQGPTGIIKLAFLDKFVSFAPLSHQSVFVPEIEQSRDEDETPSYDDLDIDF